MDINAAADDPVQQTPREVIKRGWPDIKADVPECVHLYFDIREELTLCKFDSRTLLVVSDDYHNYVEFARLHTVTFRAIIKELKEILCQV